MKYAGITGKDEDGYGAYVPDLSGCIAAGETREEVKNLIQEAIEFHIEGLMQDGQADSAPAYSNEFIQVAV